MSVRPVVAEETSLRKDIKPLLQEYCFDCHNAEKAKGDLNLVEFADNDKLYENREVWEKVVEAVELGDMPPEKKPQPTDEQKTSLVHFVEGQLANFDCNLEKNPGRVTIRRLNKEEYKNTIRDLLKVNYEPEDFPNDEVGYGFDNIGDVLSLSPMLMEKFLVAAEEIVGKAIVLEAAQAKARALKGGTFSGKDEDAVNVTEDGTLGFFREGELKAEVEFPTTGEYVFKLRAYGEQAGPEAPKLAMRINEKEVKILEVPATSSKRATYEIRVQIEKGRHTVALAYLNNYREPDHRDPKLRGDRNVFVDKVEMIAPDSGANLPESHRQLITKIPAAGQEHQTAEELLRPFLARAYRRPVTEEELAKVVRFVDMAIEQKGTFLEGMQVAVQAVLCSPNFLFRWELDSQEMQPGQTRELNDYEVASRLSYFLWSSMPDEEMQALAAKGELRKDGNMEKQVARMIGDWKARAFVTSFAGQWLQIRNIWEISPDPESFPKWSDELKGMMKEETELFFQAIMKEDRPITDILAADFTFLNEKLAAHYGIAGVSGNEFRRVQLPADSLRGGVLSQGSVLLTTSTPTRTSPVNRGKWVLEQILGSHPPPAPADVPPLAEQKTVDQSASLRQRFEQHRASAECASCHAKFDPLGFALENFDATGAWRERDGKFPIDASGKLAGGIAFNGARELKAVLKKDKRFVHSLATNMMTYALGRGLEYFDKCAVDAIAEGLEAKGNKFSALVLSIVNSEPFLKRKKVGEALAQQ